MKIILIRVPKAAEDHSLVHDLRNAAEDIYRKFSYSGVAEVREMDTATTELRIYVTATRHLGEVTTFVKKSLRRYGLAELAEVSRDDSHSSTS